MMAKLTKAQRTRLDKLATYLEGLPKRYKHFGMRTFIGGCISGSAEVHYALNNGGVTNCGTVACAVGHGPEAGILVPPRFISRYRVMWDKYASLFIGTTRDSDLSDARHFRWLFEGFWADVDNHHWGAAARIRYFLAHGEPPEAFGSYGYPTKAIRKLYAPYRIDAVPA